jgi:predicted dinucleotide-utilizing enzyme
MVSGSFRLTADDPKISVPFGQNVFTGVWFSCDNTYANAVLGIAASPQQSLRVAVMGTDGAVLEVHNIVVGDAAGATTHRLDGIVFKNKAKTNWLAICQGPAGPADQRIGFTLV